MRAQDFNIMYTSKLVRVAYHVLFWITLYVLDVVVFGLGYENVNGFITIVLAEVPPLILLAYVVMYWIIPQYVAKKLFFESIFYLFIVFLLSGFIGHVLFVIFSLYGNDVGIVDLPKIFVRRSEERR